MAATPSEIHWDLIPAEIRQMILKCLLHDGFNLASLATVSREWQTVIEQYNFARIKVTPLSLSDLDQMTSRNRKLVHYVWFCVELETYDCTRCTLGNDDWEDVTVEDDALVTRAIQGLFSALTLIRRVIQIIGPDTRLDESNWSRYTDQTRFDDPNHGWVAGYRMSTPPSDAILTIFEEIMGSGPFESDEKEDQWWQQLPLIPAVTGVLLRQQNRRRWKPAALAQMFPRLPRLREIHYEPWREWDKDCQKLTDKSIASASLRLENLSASFIADASYFFDACQPSWEWPNLTSIVLTSRLLTPKKSGTDRINEMLQAAAAAASKMPKLQVMEIWNGRQGLAMVFRYRSGGSGKPGGQPAVVTRRGTWEFILQPSVIQAWQAVAVKHQDIGPVFVDEVLDRDTVKSHGDAIHYLELSGSVIRPVSLQQIRIEHQIVEGGARDLDSLEE
ncbi:hypothetical protein FALBO_8304 [Fusarium albosuccineum]|uniref:PI-PLC Y-box domain-containing protein n=1 Tax=Fusarium albosuccineum TaxID=1237068 RepID=A0A8H4L8J4_9HYPO|nr:hypothetical protein FALBO_8304 [Fusarium albosuccineum]